MKEKLKLKDIKDFAQHPEKYHEILFFKRFRLQGASKTAAELALRELVEIDPSKVDGFITKLIEVFQSYRNYNPGITFKALEDIIAYTTQKNLLTIDHINQIVTAKTRLVMMPNSFIDWCKMGFVNPTMLSFNADFGLGSMTLFQHLLTNGIKIGESGTHPSIFIARHFPESGEQFLTAELNFYQHEVQRFSTPAKNYTAPLTKKEQDEIEQFRQNNQYYQHKTNFINFVKEVVQAEVSQKDNKYTLLSILKPLGNEPHQQAAFKELIQLVFENITPKQFASISTMLRKHNPELMHYILENKIKIGTEKRNALFTFKDGNLNANFTKQDISKALEDPKTLVHAHKKGFKAGDREILEYAFSGKNIQIDQFSGEGTALFIYVSDKELAAAISDTSAKNIGELFKQRIEFYLNSDRDAGNKISSVMCELIARAQKNPQDIEIINKVYQACQVEMQKHLSQDDKDILPGTDAKTEFSQVLEECGKNKKTAQILMKRVGKKNEDYSKMKYAFFMLDLEDACKHVDSMKYLVPKDKELDSGFILRAINTFIDIICSIGKSKDNLYDKAVKATDSICQGAQTKVFDSRGPEVSHKTQMTII